MTIDDIDTLLDSHNASGFEVIIKYVKENTGDTLRYHFKCIGDGISLKTKIELIGAHNTTNLSGGYAADVKGMAALVNDFDGYLVTPLKEWYGLDIK